MAANVMIDEGKELVVTRSEASELNCDLDEIAIGDAARLHKNAGTIFICGDGHIQLIAD